MTIGIEEMTIGHRKAKRRTRIETKKTKRIRKTEKAILEMTEKGLIDREVEIETERKSRFLTKARRMKQCLDGLRRKASSTSQRSRREPGEKSWMRGKHLRKTTRMKMLLQQTALSK